MKEIYTHPQEIWDEKKCEREARRIYRDGMGTATESKLRGIISPCGSGYPQLGRVMFYNGGTIIDGEHYRGELYPFPKIPDTFEIVAVPSWGYQIRKKDTP